MANRDVRQAAKEKGVKLWRIADALGVAGSTFSVWLRHELSDTRKAQAMAAIDRLSQEGQDNEQ